ncbi:MAG: glycosyltransferase family 4 protein [Mariniphaga sp.]
MKRILISIDSFYDGGAEMFAIRLANGLTERYEVHMMEFMSSASKIKAQKKQVDPKVRIFTPEYSFILRKLLQLKNLLPSVFEKYITYFIGQYPYVCIRNYIIKNSIEIVNSHAIEHNSILVRIKKNLPNLKLVLSLHGHYELYRKNYEVERFNALIHNHISGFNRIIYTTQDQLNTFTEFGLEASKATKIFYGLAFNIHKDQIKPVLPGKILRLILVSRAIIEKGWVEAIQAVESINKSGIKVSILLVGDGPILTELKSKNQHEFIKFTGNIENVFPLIQDVHIGLLPTYYHAESFPNSIIEYLSCGKPVIASNIGAISEMLTYENEIAGELIDCVRGNPICIYDLKTLIMKYIDNPGLYQSKVKLALQASEKFKLNTCIKEYSNIF